MIYTKWISFVAALSAALFGCTVSSDSDEHPVPESVLRHYLQAERAYAEGVPEEALAHLERALREEPRFVPALFLSGKILILRNEHAHGIERLEAVVEVNSDHLDGRKWLARAYRISGDGTRAQEVLLPALRVSTEDPELLVEMARIQRDAGNVPGAIEYYTKALAFSDRLAVAAYELAEIFAAFGVGARAMETLERARSLASDTSSIGRTIENRLESLGVPHEE